MRNRRALSDEGHEGEVETTYGDFQEHRLFVCDRCHRRWDWWIAPAMIGLSVLATLAIASTALSQSADWVFGLGIVVLVGGIVGASALTTHERLKRAARRARGGGTSAKAFTEQEYRAMVHMG